MLCDPNGILNNELYVGRLVWNRQRFIPGSWLLPARAMRGRACFALLACISPP